MDRLTLRRPDDWHLHLRDGAAMESVVADTARRFARAIVMPNLKPPVTTTQQALHYRERILGALQATGNEDARFEPLMTLYLTDRTSAEDVAAARSSGFVRAIKYYPAGATTRLLVREPNRGATTAARPGEEIDIPFFSDDDSSKEVEISADDGDGFATERVRVRAGQRLKHVIKLRAGSN